MHRTNQACHSTGADESGNDCNYWQAYLVVILERKKEIERERERDRD